MLDWDQIYNWWLNNKYFYQVILIDNHRISIDGYLDEIDLNCSSNYDECEEHHPDFLGSYSIDKVIELAEKHKHDKEFNKKLTNILK